MTPREIAEKVADQHADAAFAAGGYLSPKFRASLAVLVEQAIREAQEAARGAERERQALLCEAVRDELQAEGRRRLRVKARNAGELACHAEAATALDYQAAGAAYCATRIRARGESTPEPALPQQSSDDDFCIRCLINGTRLLFREPIEECPDHPSSSTPSEPVK